MSDQLHAGRSAAGESLWHADPGGHYWCGSWHHRTPAELLAECQSTIADLARNHPDLEVVPPPNGLRPWVLALAAWIYEHQMGGGTVPNDLFDWAVDTTRGVYGGPYALAKAAIASTGACLHEWGIDGAHSNQYCKKCFRSRESVATAG